MIKIKNCEGKNVMTRLENTDILLESISIKNNKSNSGRYCNFIKNFMFMRNVTKLNENIDDETLYVVSLKYSITLLIAEIIGTIYEYDFAYFRHCICRLKNHFYMFDPSIPREEWVFDANSHITDEENEVFETRYNEWKNIEYCIS